MSEVVDLDTGYVVDDHPISFGDELRAFSYEEWVERARAGGRVTAAVHDYGLHTYITGKTGKVKRLAKLNESVRLNGSEKLVEVLTTIHRFAKVLGLGENVTESACILARKTYKYTKIAGDKQRDALALASILVASKMFGVPVTEKDIVSRFGVDKTALRKYIKVMFRNKILRNVHGDAMRLAMSFASRIVDTLSLPPHLLVVASKLVQLVYRAGTVSTSPDIVAASCVYLAAAVTGSRVPAAKIAEVVNRNEMTIRTNSKKILSRIDIVVAL